MTPVEGSAPVPKGVGCPEGGPTGVKGLCRHPTPHPKSATGLSRLYGGDDGAGHVLSQEQTDPVGGRQEGHLRGEVEVEGLSRRGGRVAGSVLGGDDGVSSSSWLFQCPRTLTRDPPLSASFVVGPPILPPSPLLFLLSSRPPALLPTLHPTREDTPGFVRRVQRTSDPFSSRTPGTFRSGSDWRNGTDRNTPESLRGTGVGSWGLRPVTVEVVLDDTTVSNFGVGVLVPCWPRGWPVLREGFSVLGSWRREFHRRWCGGKRSLVPERRPRSPGVPESRAEVEDEVLPVPPGPQEHLPQLETVHTTPLLPTVVLCHPWAPTLRTRPVRSCGPGPHDCYPLPPEGAGPVTLLSVHTIRVHVPTTGVSETYRLSVRTECSTISHRSLTPSGTFPSTTSKPWAHRPRKGPLGFTRFLESE